MKQNLKVGIQKWKKAKTASNELRSIRAEKSAILDGEYTLSLTMAKKVTYMSESEQIQVTSEMRTMGQRVSDDELDNPKGDIQVFESCAKKLENNFEIKFEETYSKLWRSQTPDGFV